MLLVLLGAWGALVPLIGPYFRFAYSPDSPWTYTTGRLWLEILPGTAAFIGGIILLVSRLRMVAILGAWIGAVSGAWFAIGSALSPLWTHRSAPAQGVPVGGTAARAIEQIGFFAGLGVVLAFVAAVAIGRLTVLAVGDVGFAVGGGPASAPTAAPAEAPAGRLPAAAAILRRVVAGKATAAPASGERQGSAPPAKVRS
jgi:hypothetical protein